MAGLNGLSLPLPLLFWEVAGCGVKGWTMIVNLDK